MRELPARLRNVGVDEDTLQNNHEKSASIDEFTNYPGFRAQVCKKKGFRRIVHRLFSR